MENVFKWVTSEIGLPMMFSNLIICGVCACFGSINTMIDQRAGLGLVIVFVEGQEVSIMSNGSLPLITRPDTRKVMFKHSKSFLFSFKVCAQVCLS